MKQQKSIVVHLQARKPDLLHVIDPFKVALAEACEKAAAVYELGLPGVILASTDWRQFEETLERYVEGIRAVAPALAILLHFPPRKGYGMPSVSGADALLYPFLLESSDPYFVWESYVDTIERHDKTKHMPEMIRLSALTFGPDVRSRAVMGVSPVATEDAQLDKLAWATNALGLAGVYLYSRNAEVPDAACAAFRQKLAPEQLIFCSGGVRSSRRADQLFAAGADYVAFSGALERPDWEPVLLELVQGSEYRAAGTLCRPATGTAMQAEPATPH